jgi:flap endonuclease-1
MYDRTERVLFLTYWKQDTHLLSSLHYILQSVREVPLQSLNGRKIAIDASMAIYQFLIAVRSNSGGGGSVAATMLTNAEGETTSHIQGMFNRTIRYMTEGIRPVFIFDGKPPSLKSGELLKRREKRIQAERGLREAQETGDVEEEEKHSKRLVRAGQKENDDCKKLLKLMGIPVLTAPCEAEAQAASLAREGLVYAAGTEDMDALTFQTPILVRKLTFANASKSMLQTITYSKALEGLQLSHDEFVDLCILLGCDYCDSIRGVGPKTALKLIREHKNIETILQNINTEKYKIPDDWLPPSRKRFKTEENTDDEQEKDEEEPDEDEFEPVYVQARRLFNEHEVTKSPTLKWTDCQPEPLTKFLVDDMGFNPDRVKSSIEKLQKAVKATSKPQSRMDSFFQVKATSKSTVKPKQKASEPKKKGGFFGKRKR